MNFVFFFPDELRAEAISAYGNDFVKTPNFDKLASQAVLFEQCHVQNTVCAPSRCSMATGRYVHVDGHRTLWNLIKPHEKNLFGYLKDSGYDVIIYGKNDLFSKESVYKFTNEFVHHEDEITKTKSTCNYGEDGFYNFLHTPISNDEEKLLGDYKNVKAGIEFLNTRKKTDRPFILFLPLSFPHCPYTAPEKYYNMYDDIIDDIKLRPHGVKKANFQKLIREYRKTTDGQAKKINAVYHAMVSYTDMLLGKVMGAIEKLESETTLIVAADHGDYAGDYGLVEKWPSGCEDVLTRVPLIIKTPTCKQGHRVKQQVELFDILPTVLELADIECTHTHFAHSLVAQLSGGNGEDSRIVYCEGGYNENEPYCSEGAQKPSVEWMKNKENIYHPKYAQQKNNPESVCRFVMARSLTHKLVYRSDGKHELYDLQSDTDELYNIYNDTKYNDIQMKMEKNLLEWFLNTSDCVPLEEDTRLNENKYYTP